MTFADPWRVVLIPVAVVTFVWFYSRAQQRADASALAYSHLPFLTGAAQDAARWERVLIAGWCAGIAALTLALAHPQARLWVPARDAAVIVCIDTSGSMASTDVTPTRWDAAKESARTFLAAAPEGTKVGIVAFDGDASVLSPPTAQRDQVTSALDAVPSPNGGTAIGDAIDLALRSLPARGRRAIVVITDGVSNRGADPMAAAQEAARKHVRLYTVGIGTNSGAIVPGTDVEATIDEDALRAYAAATGGAYARADNAQSLRDALAALARTATFERARRDLALACAIAGGALCVATSLFGLAVGRFP